MLKTCKSDFNLQRHIIPFMQDAPFFAEISRNIRKEFTMDLPTAAISFDYKSDQLTLYANPDFFKGLTNWEIRGVLTHEFYHLVFCHLSHRRRQPHRLWNIATDLAINSLILKNLNRPRGSNDIDDNGRALPKCVLVPGQWPIKPDGREMSEEEKKASSLGALIASFPTMQASEFYFNALQSAAQKEQQERSKNGGVGEGEPGEDGFGAGDEWINSMDDHDPWDSIPDERREYVEGKIKSIVEKAVRVADGQPNGWGNIPAELQAEIRRSVSNIVNWRAVLRQFIGNVVRGGRTSSIKRINRRYPYIHPGLKRGYVAKLLIARDESGSVYDEMLQEFTAELSTLTRKVEIDFIPFDCYADDKDIVRWAKNTVPAKALKRTRGGGTNFDAPTEIFNDPKNRGRWNGLLIMTDGMAPAPGPCRGKRGWVLAKGCKLEFPSEEIQIFVEKDRTMEGAWR